MPDETPPDEVTLDVALKLLDQAAQGEDPLGTDAISGKPVYLKVGRFGPYVQLGTPDDEEKPKNASLLKGMDPKNVDLATAPRCCHCREISATIREKGEAVMAHNGRFGPYIKCDTDTRSLPADLSPLDVTLEQGLHLLAQPKVHGRGRAAAAASRLRF